MLDVCVLINLSVSSLFERLFQLCHEFLIDFLHCGSFLLVQSAVCASNRLSFIYWLIVGSQSSATTYLTRCCRGEASQVVVRGEHNFVCMLAHFSVNES